METDFFVLQSDDGIIESIPYVHVEHPRLDSEEMQVFCELMGCVSCNAGSNGVGVAHYVCEACHEYFRHNKKMLLETVKKES